MADFQGQNIEIRKNISKYKTKCQACACAVVVSFCLNILSIFFIFSVFKMSVIIRLQGLSWSASAMDIRNFFKGLSIPPGGVRIIGGDNGDAFIAFSTDEDARQAMMLSNKPLNDSPVQLFLSSKTEMQNTISQAKDKTPSVPASDATSINSGKTPVSPQIPSVQEISRAFPTVGQIMGSLGIQPPLQINQLEGGIQSNMPQGSLQQPTRIFDYVNNQQQNIQSKVGKQIERDLPGEYSIGGFQGLNKHSEIKPNTLAHPGLIGNVETNFHKNEFGQSVGNVQNTFSNTRPPDNFHGEVYFPPKNDIPFNNQSKSSTGHGRSFQSDHSNLNRNYGGHGKQVQMVQQFTDFSPNDNRFGHPNFQQSNRQFNPNVPPVDTNIQGGNIPNDLYFPPGGKPKPPVDTNIQGGNIPNDLYFPPGGKPNDPYIPPNSSLKNQPSHINELRFSQSTPNIQMNTDSSVRMNSQNFPPSSNQGNSTLSTTSRSYDPSLSKSGTTDKSSLTSRSRQSRFAPANVESNRPIDSLSQPMDQRTSSSLSGSVMSNPSIREDKIGQGRPPNPDKASGSMILSNKQDEFGRNLPYTGRDSSKSPTQNEKYGASRNRDKSDLRDSTRTDSRERDRSRDRTNRRDSPRDRRDRDRDRSRRDRDDDRRSRRDRDRDYDRKNRDRDTDRSERNRDRDPKRSPSVGSSRKSRKRSLSPNDNYKNEKEKKLQTEKPSQDMKLNAVDQVVTETKSEQSALSTNYDNSSKKDTEQKNSNSLQALFPVIPTPRTSKGILGEAPAGLTGFRNNIQRGVPLLDTPVGNVTNDSHRGESNPSFGVREDRATRVIGDGSRLEDRFGGRVRDGLSEEYDRSFNNQHNYRDPYYSRDENLNRNRQPEELRHERFFDRNHHDMRTQPNPDDHFMQRDREQPFDDRRHPELMETNRGPDSEFYANKSNFPPFQERNQDFQHRPSLLGDGGVHHDIRERQGPDSDFRGSQNEVPSLFDDIQNRRRHDFQGRGRGRAMHSRRGGHEPMFRNDPSFDRSREVIGREDQNNFSHPREINPDFYDGGHHGPPPEPFTGHGNDDEYFNPEHEEMRNNRQPFIGRGFRGRGFHNMPRNMRGANIGPPGHREFHGDEEKGHMQERRGRFTNIEEQPFDIEKGDFDGRERYDNRALERHHHQTGMEARSSERDRNDRNFERCGNRNERDQPTPVTGRSRDVDGNRNRDVQRSSNEPSSSHELKQEVEKQKENKYSIPGGENTDRKTKSEKEPTKVNALCSIVLENIPIETTYKEIRKLFAGLELPKDGIKIINNEQGKRIGKAFVRFGSQDSFKKGLQKDRSRLGRKIIIIKPIPRKEFDNAIDSYVPPDDDDEDGTPNIDMCNSLSATLRALKGEPVLKVQKKSLPSQKDFVVKITLLPEYTKIQNIKSYFKDDFKIATNSDAIVIESNRHKACTGLCYVQFSDENSFDKALNLKRMFDRKVIKIEKGSKKELYELRDRMKNIITLDKESSQGNESTNTSSKEVQEKSESDNNLNLVTNSKTVNAFNSEQTKSSVQLSPAYICLRVRNIPRSLKVFELRNVFEECDVNVKIAQICHDAVGKAIGEGYLEFTSSIEVEKCLVKNGTFINRNKITVEAVTKPQMIDNMRCLRQSLQPETPTTQAVFFFVKAENLPKNVSTGEIMNFFSGYNPAPESIRLNINENKDQPNCSTALVGFRTREQAETAIAAINGNILRNQSIKLTKLIL